MPTPHVPSLLGGLLHPEPDRGFPSFPCGRPSCPEATGALHNFTWTPINPVSERAEPRQPGTSARTVRAGRGRGTQCGQRAVTACDDGVSMPSWSRGEAAPAAGHLTARTRQLTPQARVRKEAPMHYQSKHAVAKHLSMKQRMAGVGIAGAATVVAGIGAAAPPRRPGASGTASPRASPAATGTSTPATATTVACSSRAAHGAASAAGSTPRAPTSRPSPSRSPSRSVCSRCRAPARGRCARCERA